MELLPGCGIDATWSIYPRLYEHCVKQYCVKLPSVKDESEDYETLI